MTNYTKTTDFAAKDSLPSGNAAKIVKGSEIDTEFNNIATASATKANANNAVLTGTTTAQTLDISGNVDVDGTLETDALSLNGVTVTSTAAELNYVDGVTSNIQTQLDTKAPLASPTFTGTVTVPGLTTTANVLFGDNDKAIFGAGSDLSIYSDGTQSFIQEDGPGALYIQGTHLNFNNAAGNASYITAVDGGAVTLFSGGSAKLATTSTGIDVTGSVVSDGLTVSNSSLQVKLEESDGTYNPRLVTYFDSSGTHLQHTWSSGADSLFLEYGGSEGSGTKALGIQGGDISFYEDTGTTPKLFWDASAEALGIGTSSPISLLQLLGSPVATSGALATFRNADATSSNTSFGGVLFNSSPGTDYSIGKSNVNAVTTLSFRNANSGASYMDIDSSGNVGIGTSSPSVALDVQAASGASRINVGTGGVAGNHGVNVVSGGANNDYGVFFNGSMALGSNTTTGTQLKIGSNGSETTFQTLTLHTNASERMRIDASGDLTVKGGRIFVNESDNGNTAVAITRDADEGYVNLYSSGTQTVEIRGNGNSYFNGGNLLVGRTSASYSGVDLHVGNTSDSQNGIQIQTSTTGYGYVLFGDGTGADAYRGQITYKQGDDYMSLHTAGGERMRIDSSGNVGIGTTGGTAPLHILKAATGVNAATDVLKLSSVDTNPAYYVGFQTQRDNSAGMGLNILTTNVSGTVSESLRISTSGNVGIGTSGDNPTALLEVEAASNPEISIASSGGATSNFLNFKAISHSQQIQTQLKTIDNGNYTADLAFLFKASGTSGALAEQARLAANGTFLIGCTGQTGDAPNSDGFLFEQIGNVKIRVNSDGQVCQQYYSPTGGTSSPVGTISVGASSTSFNTSSDQRLKENIADADDAGSKVDAIQVRQFDWIADGSHQDYGMVAQELQSVAPEAVTGDGDSDEMMGVDYSKLVPMLVKEIQSLRARVAQLENN